MKNKMKGSVLLVGQVSRPQPLFYVEGQVNTPLYNKIWTFIISEEMLFIEEFDVGILSNQDR